MSAYTPLHGGIGNLTPGGPAGVLGRGQVFNPYALPADPFLGGQLGIGRTGLGGLPRLPGVGQLPYTGGGGLAQQATRTAAPVLDDLMMAGETQLANQMGRAATSGGMRGMLGALPLKGATPKGALGWGALGSVGAMGVDRLNVGGANSLADQFLTGAAFGGGQGMAFGPWGAAIGAPVGGLANVALNALGVFGGDKGEEKADPVEVLAAAMDEAALPPQYEEFIVQQYDTALEFAKAKEGKEREDLEAAAYQTAAQQVQMAMQEQQMLKAQAMGGQGGMGMPGGAGQVPPDMLARQQQAAQVFEPLALDIEANSKLYQQAMEHNRQYLPDSYKAFADQQQMNQLSSSNKLADAYRAQALVAPQVAAITQYQQEQESIKNQLFQQYQQAAMQGMQQVGGGGWMTGGTAPSATDPLAALMP